MTCHDPLQARPARRAAAGRREPRSNAAFQLQIWTRFPQCRSRPEAAAQPIGAAAIVSSSDLPDPRCSSSFKSHLHHTHVFHSLATESASLCDEMAMRPRRSNVNHGAHALGHIHGADGTAHARCHPRHPPVWHQGRRGDNSVAFREAMEAASRAMGGAEVLLPAGSWMTAPT